MNFLIAVVIKLSKIPKLHSERSSFNEQVTAFALNLLLGGNQTPSLNSSSPSLAHSALIHFKQNFQTRKEMVTCSFFTQLKLNQESLKKEKNRKLTHWRNALIFYSFLLFTNTTIIGFQSSIIKREKQSKWCQEKVEIFWSSTKWPSCATHTESDPTPGFCLDHCTGAPEARETLVGTEQHLQWLLRREWRHGQAHHILRFSSADHLLQVISTQFSIEVFEERYAYINSYHTRVRWGRVWKYQN